MASNRNMKGKDEVITQELHECHVIEIQIQVLGM